jgi:molybdate transport system regulatory protein
MKLMQSKLVGKLVIDAGLGSFLGDKRIRLLEAIDKYGSISKAAKMVPISYKGAWEAVDEINNLSPEPVVLRTIGRKHGGGTDITTYGRRLIAFYRALEQDHQSSLEKLSAKLDQGGVLDAAAFRGILKRMSMKTSARNQFAGPVTRIKEGVVDCEVTILLDQNVELTAVVTRESSSSLGLLEGKDVLAFVKASSILLMDYQESRISARNRFGGMVTNIHAGPVNAEVSLTLPNGRHVITAVITKDSVDHLALKVGSPVTAVFKASSVFLVSLD